MSDVDDLLEVSEKAKTEEQANETFQFFARRYGAAYEVAKLLDIAQWVIGGITALAVPVLAVMAADSRSGGELFCSLSFLIMFAAATYISLMRAIAAFLRVLIDSAVGVAPGLSEEERLRILRKW